MSTDLTKKPANVMRNYTQQVRDHVSAMQRAQDKYFAALARAQAQYFDDVKKITEAVTQETEPTAEGATNSQTGASAPVQ